MWMPPWTNPAALGANEPEMFGPATPRDLEIARQTAEAVRANRAAGRPFYANVPPEFDRRFRQIARGMWFRLRGHPRLMIKTIDQAARDQEALRIVNKTYYNALRGISDYRGMGRKGRAPSLTAWFYAIARNAMIDDLRMYLRSPTGKEAQMTWLTVDEVRGAPGGAVDDASLDKYQSEESDERFSVLGIVARYLDAKDNAGRPLIADEDLQVFRVVGKTKGDMDAAAKILGISRMNMESKFVGASQRAEARIKEYLRSGKAGRDAADSEAARRRRALEEKLARQRAGEE